MSFNFPKTLSVKFALWLIVFAFLMLFILMAIVIPHLEKERLHKETDTIQRLLANMEQQILLTIHVNSLYNSSYWEKLDLQMHNRLLSIQSEWKDLPVKNETEAVRLLSRHFDDFACNTFLMQNKQMLYATQHLISSDLTTYFDVKQTGEWQIFDKTKRFNICPSSKREYLFLTPLDNSFYDIGIYCTSQEILRQRTEFENTIGSMLRHGFETIKEKSSGFAYMMWVKEGNEKCDHNAGFRKSNDPKTALYNQHCCVSESSPTDEPLTGNLTPNDYLNAAKTGEPMHHLLAKKDAPNGTLYPALTWVRYFKGSREYPFLLAATLYEEDIYRDVEPLLLTFLPAALIALSSAFVLAWLLFRRFTRKVETLLDVAHSVQKGDLSPRSGIQGRDDVSKLAQTFDAMLDSLEENIQTLDTKVATRTLELEALLKEKEVLLKEIHHRVKNNLSIIIALMQLKENQAQSEESQTLLLDLQERIYAIELLHRQLYQSTSLKEIALDVYVSGLVENMRQTYATEEKKIGLHVNIEPVFLGIEQALACGLLINECVTNAIKHAFDANGGEIEIGFTCKESECTLIISDTGKGLPKNFALERAQGLGMQLIEGIACQQLQGKLVYDTVQGTHFKIHFTNDLLAPPLC